MCGARTAIPADVLRTCFLFAVSNGENEFESPAGLLIALPLARPCCSSPTGHPIKKIRRCKASAGTTPYLRICKDQDPRAKQQPTGLIAYSAAGASEPPCSSPTGHPTNKKSPLLKTADFLVGCPVGLEPTVSRSTIWRVNRLRYGHHINAPEGTRTPGPLLRRQLLYPPELRAHVVIPLGSIMAAVVCRHTLREV